MLPVTVIACDAGMPLTSIGLSWKVSNPPDDPGVKATPSRRTEHVGHVKSMLLPLFRESETSDALPNAPVFSMKLNVSVNTPSVAGVTEFPNEFPKVPEAG